MTRTPRIWRLVAAVALLYAVWRVAPELLWAVLLLAGLYLVVTRSYQAGALLESLPRDLNAIVNPTRRA